MESFSNPVFSRQEEKREMSGKDFSGLMESISQNLSPEQMLELNSKTQFFLESFPPNIQKEAEKCFVYKVLKGDFDVQDFDSYDLEGEYSICDFIRQAFAEIKKQN